MVHDTNFFNFIDFLSISKRNQMWAYCKLFPVKYLNTLLWYVHPCTIFTLKVHHIKTLEPIILELRMFSRQPYALNL